jgi:hypothetical protein
MIFSGCRQGLVEPSVCVLVDVDVLARREAIEFGEPIEDGVDVVPASRSVRRSGLLAWVHPGIGDSRARRLVARGLCRWLVFHARHEPLALRDTHGPLALRDTRGVPLIGVEPNTTRTGGHVRLLVVWPVARPCLAETLVVHLACVSPSICAQPVRLGA